MVTLPISLRLRFKVRQKLHYHPDRPVQVDVHSLGNVLRVGTEGMQIDLAHNASIVDEYVEPRKLRNDSPVQARDGSGITNIALNRLQSGNFVARGVERGKGATCDDDGVLSFDELRRKLQAGATRTICDQDCSVMQFQGRFRSETGW